MSERLAAQHSAPGGVGDGLRGLEPGRVGKLQLHRSGKVTLKIGSVVLQVSEGAGMRSAWEAVVLGPEGGGKDGKVGRGKGSSKGKHSLEAIARRQAKADAAAEAMLGGGGGAMVDSSEDEEDEEAAAAIAAAQDDEDDEEEKLRYMRLGAVSGRLVASLDVDSMLPQWLRSRDRQEEAVAMQAATRIAAANSAAQVAAPFV